MAFRHGKNAGVSVNSVDLSAFCDNLDLSVSVDTAETTVFQATWKTHLAGIPGAKLSLTGKYDPTATTGPASALIACIAGAAAVACINYPGGNVSGQRSETFNGIVTTYDESSPVGGVVSFKSDITVTGAITFATI